MAKKMSQRKRRKAWRGEYGEAGRQLVAVSKKNKK